VIPTKGEVLNAARFHLGDDQVAAGQVFTDARLEQPFNLAYRELFRALQGLSNPRVRRVAFYNLPPNTSVLSPSTAFIPDMGELEFVEERGAVTAVAITAVAVAAGVATITAAAHPFQTGYQAVLYGIGGVTGLSGIFGVTLNAASPTTQFTPNGAVAAGAYTSGGVASYSQESFAPLENVTLILETGVPGSGVLGKYAWNEDILRFPACNTLRQLRITYISSAGLIGAAADTTGVDDSLDFLATRTAGIAAASRGARERAVALNALAIGPEQKADGRDGILRELVAAGVRALQNNPVRSPPFRRRRTPIDWL
jgi:hypothetical protein